MIFRVDRKIEPFRLLPAINISKVIDWMVIDKLTTIFKNLQNTESQPLKKF
jgi:hypothetical protein